MDPQLEEDLAEALGDCDPLELVLQDPLLAEVAEEVLHSCQEESASESDAVDGIPQNDTFQTSRYRSGIPSDSSHKNVTSVITPLEGTRKHIRVLSHTCVCCSRPARGIFYYGAKVCDSCRVFFGRSIKNELYKSFFCENNCTQSSDARSWIKCQRCRFDELRKAGMNIPNKKRKDSGGISIQAIFAPNENVWQYYRKQTEILLVSSKALNPAETLIVENLTVRHCKLGNDIMAKLLKQNEQILLDHLNFIYHGYKLPLQTVKLTFDYLLFNMQQIFLESSGLIKNKLSSRDMNCLVLANYPLCHEFMDALRINESFYSETDLKNGTDLFVNSVMDGLDSTGRDKVVQIHTKV